MSKFKLLLFVSVPIFLVISIVYASEESPQMQAAIDQYVKGNLKDCLPVFEKMASEGNPDAHYYLGLIFSDRQSKYFDAKKGISHISSAIELGHSQAMFHMGMMYDNGIGVQRNALVANDWYLKSRKAESPGKRTFTFYKDKGDGLVEVQYSEILKDLISQAENGDAEIQFQLARVYDDGKLVPRDFDKALHWYKKSAMNEYEEAQFTMGYFYCRGIGVKKNEAIANEWLIKSKRSDGCME
jgi:TPR repeat protein